MHRLSQRTPQIFVAGFLPVIFKSSLSNDPASINLCTRLGLAEFWKQNCQGIPFCAGKPFLRRKAISGILSQSSLKDFQSHMGHRIRPLAVDLNYESGAFGAVL